MATKVYYNSACPVCNAGIKDQRKRMEACGIRDIEWIDVHAQPEAAEQVGSPLEQVRERLHVKAADGRLDVGADAFTRLWSRTPGQRWLAKLLRLPIFRQITTLSITRLPDCSTFGIVPRDIGEQKRLYRRLARHLPCRLFHLPSPADGLAIICTRPICGLS